MSSLEIIFDKLIQVSGYTNEIHRVPVTKLSCNILQPHLINIQSPPPIHHSHLL